MLGHFLKLKVHIIFSCNNYASQFLMRNEEFHDEEFLTRKTDKENKELTSIKKGFFKAKFELLVENYSKI